MRRLRRDPLRSTQGTERRLRAPPGGSHGGRTRVARGWTCAGRTWRIARKWTYLDTGFAQRRSSRHRPTFDVTSAAKKSREGIGWWDSRTTTSVGPTTLIMSAHGGARTPASPCGTFARSRESTSPNWPSASTPNRRAKERQRCRRVVSHGCRSVLKTTSPTHLFDLRPVPSEDHEAMRRGLVRAQLVWSTPRRTQLTWPTPAAGYPAENGEHGVERRHAHLRPSRLRWDRPQ